MREEQWKALDAWIKAEQGNRATYDTAEQAGTTGGGTWLTDSLRGIAEREAQEAMRKGGMFAAVAPDDPQAPGTGGLLAGPPRETGLITADGRPRWELPLPADNALLGATQAQQRQLAEKKAAELNRAADEAVDNALPKGIPTADGTELMENRPPKAAQIPTAEGLAAVLAGRDMTPEERVEWDYAGLPERERKMSRTEFEALKETYPELARYDFATGADPTAEGFRGFVAGERIRQRFDEAENEQREQEKAQKAREENPEATRDAELGYKAAEVLYDRIGRYEADGTRQNLERLSEALENPYVKREFDEMAGSREAVAQARAEFDEECRKRLPGWQAEQIRATAQDYENNPVAFGLKQAKPSAPFVDEYKPQERRDFDLAGRLLDGAAYAAETVSQAEQDVADFRNESSGKSAAGRFLHGLKPANIENVLSLGWIEAADLLRIAQINEKASKGEALTDGEKAAAGAYLVSMDAASRLEMLGGATGWGTVGEAVGDNAAFIANMAAFGGFGSAAQQAAKRLVSKAARTVAVRAAIAAGESAGKAGAMAAAKRGLGKAAEVAVKNRLVRGAGKAAEAVIASTAGGAVMAPTSPITYTEFARRENDEFTVGVNDLGNYFAHKTDPASVWENLYKAGTTSTMENASELLGLDLAKGVGAIGRRAEKSIGKTKAGRALEMIRSRMGDMPALKRWDNYMGETFKWYGTPVELMTEEYSAFLEPLATGEPERIRENFSSAAQWDLALSVIGMGAAFNTARLPVAVYDHAQYRRRAGTLLGKIENPDIRKQVSRAMQQTTRSGQATELGKVEWENASLRDMAAATDYIVHRTQGNATKAIQDAMREQTEAKAAVERFEKLKNRDTGKAEEVTDTQGNRFFLAGGTIEKSGEETADGTVFVIDPVSEEVSQKSVDELRRVKTTSYEEFEQKALERIRTASEAQADAEALEDIMDDAAAAGDDPTARAAEYMGINLDALEGRTVTLASGEQAFISSVAQNPTSRWMEIDAVPLNPETGSTRVDEKGEEVHYLLDIRSIKEVDGVPMKRNEETADGPLGTDNGGPGQETFATLETTEKEIPGNVAEAESPANAGTENAVSGPAEPMTGEKTGRNPETEYIQRQQAGSEITPVGKGPFGNIYLQFRGKPKEAIEFLLKQREGEAVGALTHPQIGDIDLVWGNEKAGLLKIAQKHPEMLDDLQGKIEQMEILQSSDNRIVLEGNGYRAVVSKMLGQEKTPQWLLMAYEKRNVSGGSSDIGPEPNSGLQNGTAPLQNVSEKYSLSSSDGYLAEHSESVPDLLPTQGEYEVYSVPAVGESISTDASEVNSGQSTGATAPAGNSSETSLYKNTNSVPPKQEIPRKKDGTPDYAAMEPDAMFRAIAEDFGEDVALEEVARQINIYEDKIKKLSASRSEDINVRLANRNKIKELQAKADALRDAAHMFDEATTMSTPQAEVQTGANENVQPTEEAAQEESGAADPVRDAKTPTEKFRAVGQIVDEMNRASGAAAYVFNETTELPGGLSGVLDETFERDGITWRRESYICAPMMEDAQRVRRTYIHEVAGHQNIEYAIPKMADRTALWEAIVDDIGLDGLRAWGIAELNEEIENYEAGEAEKRQLGREVLAYATELNADLPWFDRSKPLSLTIDLNQRITPQTLRAILETANRYDDQRPRIEIASLQREGLQGYSSGMAGEPARGRGTANSILPERADAGGDGVDKTQAGGGATGPSVRASLKNDPRAVSEQDSARTDRAEQGTLPAGETVADEAGTATGNDNIRFRRTKQPQEAANSLIAVHNTTEEQLKKSLELGGFPMPSIAITRAEMGHTDFGEISLLFDRNSIAPSDRRNRVYGGDAWTPTFPQLGVKIDPKALEAARKDIRSLLGDKLADMYKVATDLDPFNVEVELERNNGEVRDAFARKEWMKHAYLKSKGEDFVGGWQDLHDKVPDDDQDYRKWVADVFNGLVEKIGIRNGKDMFTPTGNRRKWETLHDEVTLDNVVKAMKKQAAKGGESIFGGDIFGSAQSEYKSLAEIRKKAGERLRETTEEEQRQAREAINDLLSDINILTPDKGFGAAIDMVSNITEAVKHAHTAKDIHAYLKERYPEMTMEVAEEIADIVGDIQAMGTRYFEAKPYRAIGFDEVRLAVVPADTDAELVRQLERRRIPVQTYERGNEEQRRMIVADATEALDIRFRRAYHGSGADFDRFDHSFMGTGEGAQDYGWGTYVTEVGGIARSYAETGTGQDHNTIKDARLRNLYTVEIPDDTGTNYIRWDGPADAVDKKEIAEKLTSEVAKDLKDDAETETAAQDIRESLNEARTGGELYGAVCFYLGNEDASRFLSSLGFAGIEYPAGYTTDERVDGAKNYVIFNAEDVKITDHVRFRNMAEANAAALSPEQVNERFNEELRRQIDGTLPKSHIYRLGRPGEALRAAGVPDLPIELSAARLAEKASPDYTNHHPFALEEVENLPQAMQHPVAIFDSKTQPGSKVVLTELQHNGTNFVVAIKAATKKTAGRRVIEINSIRSVYPKDYVQDIVNWINREDLLRWADKEKLLSFLDQQRNDYVDAAFVLPDKPAKQGKTEAPIEQAPNRLGKQQSNSADVAIPVEGLSVATNIIKNLANPSLAEGKKYAAAQNMADELDVKVRIVRSWDEISGEENRFRDKRGASGWHDRRTGEIAVVLPNCRDAAEVQKTILHEAVGHYGIPELLGRERADELYRRVFDAVKDTPRAQELLAEHSGDKTVAGDEYLAEMAEGDVAPSVWKRIMAAIRGFFRDSLGIDLRLTDADMRYILWRSKNNLQRARTVGEAMETIGQDIRMRAQIEREAARERKAGQLEKLRQSEPLRFTGEEYKGLYELNSRAAGQYIVNHLRGTYTNADTGETIYVSRKAQKVAHHDAESKVHLQSAAYIPQMLENAILIDEMPNAKSSTGFDSYRYYVVGLNIGGTDYTAKLVVGEKNGQIYYDHALTEIEKGDLIDQRDLVKAQVYEDKAANAVTGTPVSTVKDKRLLSILQPEPLKYSQESAKNTRPEPQTPMQYIDRVARTAELHDEARWNKVWKDAEIENTDSEIDNTVRFRKRKTEAKHANDAQQADTGLRAKLKKAFGSEIPQNPNDPTLTTKRNVQTRIARKLQDETLSVRHLQEFVKKNGGTADITTDAHTALNREKGRVQAKIARAERELFEPLDKAIGEIIRSTDKEGEVPLTFDDVDNYAAAKAALERHASGTTALSENPLDPWNREYVEAVVKDFEERIPAQMIDEFWQRIAAIAAAQRRSARDYGLISAQKFREMEARGWKYYVPLQGLDAEFEGITSPRELFGRALDGNPKLKREAEALFKRAQGRTTKPKDVIATLRTNFCTTIALGERNTARQFLLRLVEQNPELQGDTRAAVGAERQNRTEDRAAALERVNDAFNRRLEKLTPENADSTILYIGKPSSALRAAGMEDRNIALYGNKLIKKAKQHGYSMHDVKNLPKYITEPIAVFKGSYTDGYAILTEMRINGENTLVSIDVRKGVVQDLNLVTSVFGKNSKGVVDWINKGKTLWANKKKALDYLSSSALNADATSNQGISSATNIIENFENPPIPEPEKRRGGIFEIEEVWYLRRDPTRMTDREKEAGEYFEQTTKTPERDEIERSERAAAQRDELQRELEETVRRIDGREAQKNPDLLEELLEKRRELNERIEALFDEITAVRQLPWGARYAGESQAEEREHYVSVMRHGARVNIRFSDPTVAQAVNAHAEELFGGVFGRAVEWTARRTRFLASMSTQWNPEFLLPNHVRDLIWAGVSHAVDADGNFRGYLHALPKAYGAVARHNREGKAQPMTLNERAMYNIYTPEGFAAACGALGEKRVFDTLYEDFVENGGLTGYAHMQNPQELARKIKKRTKAGYTRGAQAARMVRDGMRLLGDVSEITTRFATFAAQVGAGRDVLSAVNYAKNVTVNFNTRGEWGRGLNALFMFFNAGAQGINNVWQLAKRNPKRAPIVMAVAAAMGYAAMTLMDWALAAGAADDDEGERWWITDYERYVNLILPLRLLGWDDGYVKIPIPVELRPFWLAGVLARDVAAGRENAAKAAEKLVSALSQAFVPIDISVEHPWRAMVPSVVKPVFELTVWNEDFTGRKINRVPYPGETVPDSQLGRRNAHIAAKWFSEFLASLGGGDETTPAGMYLDEEGNLRKNRIVNMLDVSPSTIEHLVTSYGGGVARFVLRTLDFILKRGEEREVRNWPVLNRFVGEARKGIDENTRYYDIRTQYNERWALLNKNLKRMKIPPYYGSPEEAVADAEWIRTVRGKIAETEKLAKALMEQREFYERSSKEYTTFTKAMNEARAAFVEWYDRATGGEPEPEAEAETGTYDND